MRDHRSAVRCLLGLAVSICLVGCAVSDPTQYYTLGGAPASSSSAENVKSGANESTTTPQRPVAGTGAVAVGVGPVLVPGYLDRIQIVTRTATDQVDVSVFHRWAEPLPDGIARTLAEEIAVGVPTERIVVFPWQGVVARAIHYQVVVAVLRFDGRPAGNVALEARWRILGKDGEELTFRRSAVNEVAGGPGYEPMVAAMTRALATLGQEMAAAIRTVPR